MMTAVLEKKISARKVVLWVSMVSMVMLFAGLTSGYLVRRFEGNWESIDIPMAFFASTAVIIFSSISMNLALSAVKRGDMGGVRTWLQVTLGLGIAFAFCQFLGYHTLNANGIFFTGANVSGSFFFTITGLHLAHLAGGIIALLVANTKALLGRYDKDNYLGLSLLTTYWHFLDGLWIYLFVFLALAR